MLNKGMKPLKYKKIFICSIPNIQNNPRGYANDIQNHSRRQRV